MPEVVGVSPFGPVPDPDAVYYGLLDHGDLRVDLWDRYDDDALRYVLVCSGEQSEPVAGVTTHLRAGSVSAVALQATAGLPAEELRGLRSVTFGLIQDELAERAARAEHPWSEIEVDLDGRSVPFAALPPVTHHSVTTILTSLDPDVPVTLWLRYAWAGDPLRLVRVTDAARGGSG